MRVHFVTLRNFAQLIDSLDTKLASSGGSAMVVNRVSKSIGRPSRGSEVDHPRPAQSSRDPSLDPSFWCCRFRLGGVSAPPVTPLFPQCLWRFSALRIGVRYELVFQALSSEVLVRGAGIDPLPTGQVWESAARRVWVDLPPNRLCAALY